MHQDSAYRSPWSTSVRIKVALWALVYVTLFRPTPKPLNRWRLFLLQLFGTKVSGRPYVANNATIKMPWNLILHDRACLGEKADCYNLGMIILKARSTVAQQAYLCGGSHDFSVAELPLVTGPIVLEEDCFVCARAFILPGVIVGEGAIVGANATVSRDVPPWTVVGGNPAKVIRQRTMARGDRVAGVSDPSQANTRA